MKKLLFMLSVILLVTSSLHAQTSKRYGFTATVKIPKTSKEVLLQATQTWIKENLTNAQFAISEVNEKEGFITGAGTYVGDFGSATFDLTFYIKKNTVDMVADNFYHAKFQFTEEEEENLELSKGTPKGKTKKYLTDLSQNLTAYLTNPVEKISASRE